MRQTPGPASRGKWPKRRPELTAEQSAILEDWYPYWLEKMGKGYSSIVRFNNLYAARSGAPGLKTLEIGAGTGDHLLYEKAADEQEYYALELREELAAGIRSRFPNVKLVIGDCQKKIDLPDSSIDRVLAIHVLEHLDNLPATLKEVARVLRPGGVFSVVIPCEGGFGYSLGRRFSSKRIFEKRYHTNYDWMISYDHVNTADEIIEELRRLFVIRSDTYYPLKVPSLHLNLVIGLTLTPRRA